MKKIILSLLILAASCSVVNAQVRLGVKAGMNVCKFTGSDIATHSYTGFNAGGLANIKVSQVFSVQPELIYSGEGFKALVVVESIRVKDHLNYLNVPALAKFSRKGFYGETGP